jgi:hypothetical protein
MVQWQMPLAGEAPPRVQSLGAAQFTRICGMVPTFLLRQLQLPSGDARSGRFRWVHLLNMMLGGRRTPNRVFF